VPDSDDWYDIIQGDPGLRQGDILSQCPIIRVSPGVNYPLEEENIPATIESHNIVILTQSCDLDQDKVSGVVCCTHFDLEQAKKASPELEKRNAAEEIKKGRRLRYTLLAAHDDSDPKMTLRIVDLGDIFVLPKDFLQKVAAAQNPRLRLRAPYREHLSQAFARFYMRVALPREAF